MGRLCVFARSGCQRGLRPSKFAVVACRYAHCVSGITAVLHAAGLTFRHNSSSLKASCRQVPGPHRPSKRHFLQLRVSGTALQPARVAPQEGTEPASQSESLYRKVYCRDTRPWCYGHGLMQKRSHFYFAVLLRLDHVSDCLVRLFIDFKKSR